MTAANHTHRVPWYLWPIWLPIKISLFALALCGRFIGFVLGLLLILAGKLLCATILGAIIGLPLLFIGIALAFNCLFKW